MWECNFRDRRGYRFIFLHYCWYIDQWYEHWHSPYSDKLQPITEGAD